MSNKKVPLVIYKEDGTRVVVGEAVVTDIAGNLYARCLVTDEEVAKIVKSDSEFSLGRNFEVAPGRMLAPGALGEGS